LAFYFTSNGGPVKPKLKRLFISGSPLMVFLEVSAKRSWPLSKWDARSGRAVGKREDARSVNMLLDTLNLKAHNARRYLLDESREVTAEAIKNILGGGSDQKMILSIFKDHNQ
jgi:hypothetical protein